MLVKKSTLRLMFKAGNKKVRELIDRGVPLKLLDEGDHHEEIRLAMMGAFEVSGDRSSGSDAENRACDYIEQLHEHHRGFPRRHRSCGQGELGTIEKGKLADIVLLGANPLQDIANTQKIEALIVNGHLFVRTALDSLLVLAENAIKNK